MAETLKLGNGNWATKKGSTLAYNSENGNFKPLPFTFDRSTSATRVNKQGLIEVVSNNEPRIDFLNDSKGALLLEPSRSNIIQQSNKYDTYWVLNNITVASDQIGVGGNTEAWKITANSGSGEKKLNINLSVSGNHAISIYAKKGTKDYVYLRGVTSGLNKRVYFNLANGTIETDEAISSKMTNMGDGWYRCEAVFNQQLGFEFFFGITESDNTASYTDDGTGTIYVQYAQAEQGSYATSYIPTQGSIGTRVAESCSGAGNDQVFNDSEGVIYVETQPFIDGDFTSVYISLSDNTTGTNFITIQHRDSGQLRVYAGNFSTNIFLQDIDMSENLKIALQYENITDFKLYVNGISYPIYSTPTNSAFVGLNTFDFKLRGSASGYWLGQVKEAKYFNTALTDAELIALTS